MYLDFIDQISITFHHLRNKVTMHHMLTHTVHMETEQLKSSENFESSKL